MSENLILKQPDQEETNSGREILMILMGKGEYLNDNLGHEIINMFRDDKGDNYIYVQPYGTFHRCHEGRIEKIILAQSIGDGNIEILAKAWDLEQIIDLSLTKEAQKDDQLKKCSDIFYGSTLLPQIFSGNSIPGYIFVSFKAKKCVRHPEKL